MSFIKTRFIPLFFIAISGFFIPSPAIADGGLIVPHDIWEEMEEGHQVGIVTILDENTAKIDLFISILDNTGISHNVTFFVPIGVNTSNFNAMEQDLFSFDEGRTKPLDDKIRSAADDRKRAVHALFSGALLSNGAIFTPLWAPVLLTGCGAMEQQPEQVVVTDSSEISVYGIDDNTDLDALIETTGLPDSVRNTLATLKGQKVAIVKLETQTGKVEVGIDRPGPWSPITSEPGLHLSWNTQAVKSNDGNTVTYPLGTGGAWATPIVLTRVYVSAPQGLDFDIQYPELGTEHSGFDIISGSRILEYTELPAYGVDEARGSYGRLWRATYTQSNPEEDIIITVKPQSSFSRFLAGMEEGALGWGILFALVAGILIWMFAFRFLLPVFIGKDAEYAMPGWYEGLIYPGINLVFIVFPGSILYLVFLLGATAPALAIQFVIGAAVSTGVFLLIHGKRLGVSRGKALRAFILTSLCSSAAYLVLAVGFAFLLNAL